MAESHLQLLNAAGQNLDSADLSCRICLQILSDPVRLSCRHSFCKECLEPMLRDKATGECPVCRERFDYSAMHNDTMLKYQISSSRIRCEHCQKMIMAGSMRNHELSCRPKQANMQFVAPGNRSAPDAPNRSTFSCPYCSEPNLTADNLVDHCNERHRHDPRDMVCPVCLSMPWGDPHLKSANFLEHLNRRHKFEYHTYVDYEQSDEEMLQAAIAASLESS